MTISNNEILYLVSTIVHELQGTELAKCKSFGELHDYCDANEFGKDITDRWFADYETDEVVRATNCAQAMVNAWLETK